MINDLFYANIRLLLARLGLIFQDISLRAIKNINWLSFYQLLFVLLLFPWVRFFLIRRYKYRWLNILIIWMSFLVRFRLFYLFLINLWTRNVCKASDLNFTWQMLPHFDTTRWRFSNIWWLIASLMIFRISYYPLDWFLYWS